MDADLKARWVAALRSGEYKQGRGQLQDTKNRYCCLGVLCRVAGWKISSDGRHVTQPKMGYSIFFDVMSYSTSEQLWSMNDKKELTFNQIADWLEGNPDV